MFDTGVFWAAVLVTTILGRAVGGERARAALFAVASALVLWSGLGLSPWILAGVFVVAGWMPLGLRLVRGLAARRPIGAAMLVFAPVLAAWVVGKQAVAFGIEPLAFLSFVGFSYALVKAWTFLKDSVDGRVSPARPLALAGYLLHFPTWSLGPMHLYSEYEAGLKQPRALDAEACVDIAFRTLLGFVKIKLLAPLFGQFSLTSVPADAHVGAAALLMAAIAYSFVIYLDFSGYSDVTIALSRAVGFETPENFDRPYLARNIREFWQRWHISFSRTLTTYVFVPLSRALQGRLKKRQRTVMVVAYVGTFAFCGYWHGPTLGFVLWGLYHAAGLIVFDLVRSWSMKRRLAKRLSPPKGARAWAGRMASTAVTFLFVSIGWVFFALPLERLGG